MQVKEVKPINFLFFRTETKINELANLLPVAQEIYQEAVANKLAITGPIHWHYFGSNGDPNQQFTLEIALPVAEILEEYDGKYHFKRTDPFKCVTMMHDGSWLDMPRSYGQLFQYIGENQLQPLAINREIYINVDFKNPEANWSEIQVGIK
jgi:effector-binding domain-containing protein